MIVADVIHKNGNSHFNEQNWKKQINLYIGQVTPTENCVGKVFNYSNGTNKIKLHKKKSIERVNSSEFMKRKLIFKKVKTYNPNNHFPH